MQFSAETQSVLTYLDQQTENGLRKRDDLGAIMEIGASVGAAEEFNALTFG